MKFKDGLLSASLGYIVVNLPVWVEHDCTWLFWLSVTVFFWDILIRSESAWECIKSWKRHVRRKLKKAVRNMLLKLKRRKLCTKGN